MNRVFLISLASVILLGLLSMSTSPHIGSLRRVSAQTTPANIRTISLNSNDIVFDPFSGKIYASLPSSAGTNGNSIVIIDPVTATAGPSIFIGSEPNKLAISDDGKYLYVALDGAAGVRRLNLRTMAPEPLFSVGNDSFSGAFYVDDMEVRPGCSDDIAISRRNRGFSPRHEGVGLYSNGQLRQKTTPDHTGSNVIDFCNQASRLYGYNNETTEFGFRRMSVDDTGLAVLDVTSNVISGFGTDFTCDAGLVYARGGAILDPRTRSLVGTFTGTGGGLVRPDSTVGRTFFLSGSSSSGPYRLLAYDQERFLSLGGVDIPNVTGVATSLIRWGLDGIAFRTPTQIVLIQSPLISGASEEMLANRSAASFRGARIARESIVTAFGAKLATGTAAAASTPLPTSLAGTTVMVKDNAGTERPAPLFFVSPLQINYQLPPGTITGPAAVTVTAGDGTVTRGNIQVSTVAPGVFTANANGIGVVAGVALRVSPGNVQTFEPIATFDSAMNRFVTKPLDLGPQVDQFFLIFFGTGLRFNNKASLTARIGCADVPVEFAGAQGSLIGVDQVNLPIPRSLIGRGEVDVILTMDGQTANVGRINIK